MEFGTPFTGRENSGHDSFPKEATSSFDPFSVDESHGTLMPEELIASQKSDPFYVLAAKEKSKILQGMLSTLSTSEATVLRMKYGLYGDGKEYAPGEICKSLGISSEWYRRLEHNALSKLRRESNAQILRPLLDSDSTAMISPSMLLTQIKNGYVGLRTKEEKEKFLKDERKRITIIRETLVFDKIEEVKAPLLRSKSLDHSQISKILETNERVIRNEIDKEYDTVFVFIEDELHTLES
jgi:hypothetical protein